MTTQVSSVKVDRVRFDSDGSVLVGNLCLPADDATGALPAAVVTAPGPA